jgi:pimeloyl-CoA synthetase
MSNNNDKFDKLEVKLDRIDERLDGIEKILAVNTQIVKEHERRSTTLEKQLVAELTPIKDHVALMKHGFRAVVWVAVAIGGIVGVIQMLHQMGILG